MEVEEITRLESIANIINEWQALVRVSGEGQLFNGPYWYQAWMDAFGDNKALRILRVTAGEALVGLFPMIASRVHRRPWLSLHHTHDEDLKFLTGSRKLGSLLPMRQLSVAANLQCGAIRGGWVTQKGWEKKVLRAVARYLNSQNDWDVLVLPALPEDDIALFVDAMVYGGLQVETRNTGPTLYRVRPLPWPEFRAGHTKHFRDRCRVAVRDMNRLGEVQSVAITEEPEILLALEEMYELATRSWKESPRKGQSWYLPVTAAAKEFYWNLVSLYASVDGCVIHQIRIDSKLMAVMLSVVEDQTMFTLQMFYAPEAARASPGRVLMQNVIDWAACNEVEWIDFNGNSSFVRLFANEATDYAQAWAFRRRGYSGLLHNIMMWVESVRRIIYKLRASRQG